MTKFEENAMKIAEKLHEALRLLSHEFGFLAILFFFIFCCIDLPNALTLKSILGHNMN